MFIENIGEAGGDGALISGFVGEGEFAGANAVGGAKGIGKMVNWDARAFAEDAL